MAELKVCDVSKSFDGRKVIEDISIELREGELVSLLGTSGGGKTTLFNVIAGLHEPDEGKVYIETTYLSLEQTMHLQQLVDDLILLNKKVSSLEK